MALTIELSPEQEATLKAQAEAHGMSVEQWVANLVEEQSAYRPISQVIAEIMSDVPAEALASLPADGASQVDHYLYGQPKR